MKTKNCKKFCKAQTASRLKVITDPPPDKTFLRARNKKFLTEICTVKCVIFFIVFGGFDTFWWKIWN